MKKGFTLVELLAVIVILAIILAIAVPKIMDIVDDVEKNAFAINARMIVSSIRNEHFNMSALGNETDIFVMYENGQKTVYPNDIIIDYNGENPQAGGIIYGKEGNVVYSLYNGEYCFFQTIDNKEPLIEELSESECIEKIMYKQGQQPFTNLITNGDFSNGTSGWKRSSGTMMVEDNIMNFSVSSTAVLYYDTNIDCVPGDEIYFRMKVKRTENLSSLDIRLRGTETHTTSIIIDSVTKQNEWYVLSGVGTVTSNITGKLRLVLYVVNSSGINDVIKVDGNYGVTAINLTQNNLDYIPEENLDLAISTANFFYNSDSIISPIYGSTLPSGIRNTIENGYLIQRVSNDYLLSENQGWTSSDNGLPNTYRLRLSGIPDVVDGTINNTTFGTWISSGTSNNDSENLQFNGGFLYLRINRDRLTTSSVEAFKDWLNQNPITIMYQLATITKTENFSKENLYFEITPFNKIWFDTLENKPKKFSEGNWINF